MKILFRCAAAIAAACMASTASAVAYDIGGNQAYDLSTAVAIQTPAAPAFTSGDTPWQIDVDNPVLSGSFEFSPYALQIDIGNENYVDIVNPQRRFSFQNAWGTYDSVARTLVFTHVLFTESNDGFTCGGSGDSACPFMPDIGLPQGIGEIHLLLDRPGGFTGIAYIYQLALGFDGGSCMQQGGNNLCGLSTLTFQGTAVPVPASAWLFGSGVAALLAAARRRIDRASRCERRYVRRCSRAIIRRLEPGCAGYTR